MATLTVTSTDRAGTVSITGIGVAAASGGDAMPNTGNQTVVIKNGSGSSITVTFPLTATLDGQSATSKTVTVTAGSIVEVGPFDPTKYNDGNGRVNWTYSAYASVTVMARQNGSI